MSSFLGGLAQGLGGGAIGHAVFELLLDDRRYSTELSKAEATTSTKTSGMAQSASKLSATAIAAYAAAGAAVVGFAKDSIQAAVEQNQSDLKLQNSIAASASVSNDAYAAFVQQAGAIRDLTGVEDDAVQSVQAFLVQMGATQSEVTALTPLIVDLSAKMNIGLDQAAKAVGKSLNGSVGGLQRMAVVVDKTKAATDPFAATLEALQKSAAGFAQQRAIAEPWRLLGAAIQEAKEQVGNALLPALKEVIPEMTTLTKDLSPALAESFHTIAESAQPLIDSLDVYLQALDDVTGHTKGATDSQSGLAEAFSLLNKVNPLPLLGKYNRLIFDHIGFAKEDAQATEQQGGALTQLSAADRGVAQAATASAKALRDQKQAQDELAGGALGLFSTLEQLRTDQAEVNKLRRQGKTDSKEYADAVQAELQDQLQLQQALETLAANMRKAGADTGDVRQRVFELGRESGLTKDDVRTLWDSMSSGAKDAHDNITSVSEAFGDLRDKTRGGINVPINVQIAGIAGTQDFATQVRALIVRELASKGL